MKIVDRDKQYPLMHNRTTSLIGKREIRNSFSSLGGWRSERKNSEVILSHPTNSSYTFTKTSCSILLWTEILWFVMRPIFLPSQ